MEESELLKDVEQGQEFKIVTGQTIKNIYELVETLKGLDQQSFSYHCNKDKDDFSTWIGDALHNVMLSNILKRTKNQQTYIRILEKTIKHKEFEAQAKAHTVRISKIWLDNNKKRMSELHENLKEYEQKLHQKHSEIDRYVKELVELTVKDIIMKQHSTFKAELEKTMTMNERLEKKFEESLKTKDMLMETSVHNFASKSVEKHFMDALKKHKEHLDQEYTKTYEMIKRLNGEFETTLKKEKEEAKNLAQSAIHNEFAKSLEKQRKIVDEELQKSIVRNKELEKTIVESLKAKESGFINTINESMNKQLLETIGRQRTFLDNELSKTVKSNKEFVEKFETEIMKKEKKLTETITATIEKHLEKHKEKHEKELNEAQMKTAARMMEMQKSLEKDIESKKVLLMDELSKKVFSDVEKKIHHHLTSTYDTVNKNIDQSIKQKELQINTFIDATLKKRMTELLDTHKKNFESEIDKNLEKLIIEKRVKLLEDISKHIAAKTEEHFENKKALFEKEAQKNMEKHVAQTIIQHRDILGKELEKSLSNAKLITADIEGRFKSKESELSEKSEALVSVVLDRKIDNSIQRHNARMESETSKIKEFVKQLRQEVGAEIKVQEKHIGEAIEKGVQESLEKHFLGIVAKHKKSLDEEIDTARKFNEELEKKFEDTIKEKEEQIMASLNQTLEEKFDGLLGEKISSLDKELSEAEESNEFLAKKKEKFLNEEAKQLSKLEKINESNAKSIEKRFSALLKEKLSAVEQELSKMKKINTSLEKRKDALANHENKQISTLQKIADSKIKKLEEEAKKYGSRVEKLNTLTDKAESIINDAREVKELKKGFIEDQQILSQGIAEYDEIKKEIADIKEELNNEKILLQQHQKKLSIYEMINKCILTLRLKQLDKAKQLYQQISGLYKNGGYGEEERVELYPYILALYEEIETHEKAMNIIIK